MGGTKQVKTTQDNTNTSSIVLKKKTKIEMPNPTALTLNLPKELWALIFGWIPTTELYPNCFLINKSLLAAVLDDLSWKDRCKTDFNLQKLKIRSPLTTDSAWRAAYRAKTRLRWDENSVSLSETFKDKWAEETKAQKKQQTGTEKDLNAYHALHRSRDTSKIRINRSVIQYQARKQWTSVKATRGFSSGKHSFDFKIRKSTSDLACLGVADQEWESRLFDYVSNENEDQLDPQRHPVCYWKDGCFWDVSGGGTAQYGRKKGWKAGDKVGVTIDFEQKQIHYFLNGDHMRTQPIKQSVTTLWPVVAFYSQTQTVTLKIRRTHYPTPSN